VATQRLRVAMVALSPTPYYTAIQNALADLVDLSVIFMGPLEGGGSVWAAFDDPWGGPRRFHMVTHPAFALTLAGRDFRSQFSFGVSARLAHLGPDVLLIHSWGPTMLEPLVWATLKRSPVLLWTESGLSTGLVRSRASDVYRQMFVKRADSIVSIGSAASEYVLRLGAEPRHLWEHSLPSPLAGVIGSRELPQRSTIRRFLFVGRMAERKRPLVAIQAFLRLADVEPDVLLRVVGDGPLLESAMAQAGRHRDRIQFSGRLEGPDLAPAYLDADALVVPSDGEVWGLTVNEALAAGLYVIATDRVGSAADLLGPGLGRRVPPDNVDALAAAMRGALAEDGSPSARARRRDRIRRVTPESFAATLEAAARDAVKRRFTRIRPSTLGT
jgi:glycosyltransferase involved in cell wall biosynthesis